MTATETIYELYPEITDTQFARMRIVADKMRNLALERGWGIECANDMYLLGLIHDIGYAVERADHCASGARLLERNGYRYAFEVAKHTTMPADASLCSKELLLLWEANLTTDAHGDDISLDEAINCAILKHGTNSYQYKNISAIVDILKERI